MIKVRDNIENLTEKEIMRKELAERKAKKRALKVAEIQENFQEEKKAKVEVQEERLKKAKNLADRFRKDNE